MEPEELERRFVYHPPTEETRLVHEELRGMMLGFAADVTGLLGREGSREVSLFVTALEEASFWAHAHIARNSQ